MTLPLVVVLGAGDLGTACALRLFRSGFKVVLMETDSPYDIHYSRNFSEVSYCGSKAINGVRARTPADLLRSEALPIERFERSYLSFMLNNKEIPFLTGKDTQALRMFDVDYLVVAEEELLDDDSVSGIFKDDVKRIVFSDSNINTADYVILDNGFVKYPFLSDSYAGKEVNAAETGGNVCPVSARTSGFFIANKDINEPLSKNEEIGKVDDIPVISPCAGILSGCINSGLYIKEKSIVAEVCAEGEGDGKIIPAQCNLLAGGVLESILFDWTLEGKIG